MGRSGKKKKRMRKKENKIGLMFVQKLEKSWKMNIWMTVDHISLQGIDFVIWSRAVSDSEGERH